MFWKRVLENCVRRSIQTRRSTRKKFVRVVLSPDVDGVLSTVLLAHYMWEKHRAETEIVATFNGRYVRMNKDLPIHTLKDAIWIDLDVRFSEIKCCIGQHFLGPLTIRTSSGSFNPNCLFQIEHMKDKYPFATAHLILFGLLSDIPPVGMETALGKALIGHADSCYWVCRRYNANCKKWADILFESDPTPSILHDMLSEKYINTNLEGHVAFVEQISKNVYNGRTQTDAIPVNWRPCTGNQTCIGTNETILFRNVNALTKMFSKILSTYAPTTFSPQQATTVWEGTKIRVEASSHTKNLEDFMQKNSIRSHAVTSSQIVSMTQGPELFNNIDVDVSLY
jgi:hypothetical protein